MRYRFDAKSGHIFDGDHAVAYSHVTEWGEELVEALNAHATLTEQLAEAKAKVERFEPALMMALKGLRLYNMTHFSEQRRICQEIEAMCPDVVDAFEALQEGRDG